MSTSFVISIVATALLLAVPVEGFAPPSYRSIVAGETAASSPSPSAICLTPDDQGGRTLVAHSQRYLEQLAKEKSAVKGRMLSSTSRRASAPSRRHKGRTGILAAAKRFLTHQDESSSDASGSLDDEVLYPIVGFNLVDGSAVPMEGQHAVCSIQSTQRQSDGEEESFGYWAPPSKGGMWM